jgi:thiamine pyrophosphate-dependent acetolactate synthase large subunit-like protein
MIRRFPIILSSSPRIIMAGMTGKPDPAPTHAQTWGSDPIAALLRALDIEFIALTPGASFRGFHDSLVNYLGNQRPELLLALHEENAVAIAHGYARATGRPMAVALHANVGLMHAAMAIFNAWCDRMPMLILGAQGPMDAVHRRPWVDWIHTARDLGALVRGYVKWDDLPASVPAAIESILRAHMIATTAPQGPVYVCLDAGLQEQRVDGPIEPPPLDRFRAPAAGDPPAEAVGRAAAILVAAKRPVILMGRVSASPEDWRRRVELAEKLNAQVITDLKWGAVFPTAHPLHPFAPGLYINADAYAAIRDADAILSLDWIDLAGTLRQACDGDLPRGAVVQCSLDQYCHNGWSMDHQGLPPADVSLLAAPDRVVEKLLTAIGPRAGPTPRRPARPSTDADTGQTGADAISVEAMARAVSKSLDDCKPTYIRLPIGWPGEYCRFAHPLDFLGYDGGGGIGSGPGMAVGAALALRASGRLPVAVLGDGDYLMGLTAIWSAVRYRVALLVVVANNQSFFNDELHQERIARERARAVENRWIGMRMDDPPLDLAMLARGQGAVGIGPVRRLADLEPAMAEAIARVREGATCVIDVHVAPEYARATSAALLRQIPARG